MPGIRVLVATVLGAIALVVCCLVGPSRAEEASGAPERTVPVLCEVWRVSAPDVLEKIEAITDARPGAAEAVRDTLQAGGAERLARILTPATPGKPVQLADLRKIPLRVTTTVGGFLEVGARLQLLLQRSAGPNVRIDLELQVLGLGGDAETVGQPTQISTELEITLEVPLGQLCLFVSQVRDDDAVVVFLRAGAPSETDAFAPADERTGGDGPFTEAEIARFQALKEQAELSERKERYEQMIRRQLDRLGVELTEEQRAEVVTLTIGYRTALREALRGAAPAGVDREEVRATADRLREEYSRALLEVVGTDVAEKIVASLGRYPGFGARSR